MTVPFRMHRIATTSIAVAVLAVVAAAFAPQPAAAQTPWIDRRVPHTVQLEILKPNLDEDDDDFSFGSTAWYLTGRMEISPTVHALAELPFATADVDVGVPIEDVTGWIGGNPYVGVEIGSASSVALGEFGIRPPLGGQKLAPQIIGLASDTERWPAWFDVTTLRAGVRLRSQPSAEGFWVDGRLAPELWIVDEDSFGGGGELWWATYGVAARYDRPVVRAGLGFSGRAALDNFDQGVGESTLHQLDLTANFLSGHIRPGVSMRLPLEDDASELIDVVWGVSVAWVP